MKRKVDLEKARRAYGSYTNLAKRLRLPLTTVHGWKLRDHVPSWRVPQILAAAREDGFRVTSPCRREEVSV